jgi:hypothetical protein
MGVTGIDWGLKSRTASRGDGGPRKKAIKTTNAETQISASIIDSINAIGADHEPYFGTPSEAGRELALA